MGCAAQTVKNPGYTSYAIVKVPAPTYQLMACETHVSASGQTCHDENDDSTNTVNGCTAACAQEQGCEGFAFGVAGQTRSNDCCVYQGKQCNSNDQWEYYEILEALTPYEFQFAGLCIDGSNNQNCQCHEESASTTLAECKSKCDELSTCTGI